MKLPYQNANVASEDFQILEDLATGTWYSEVLFAALELKVFDALSEGPCSLRDLAMRLECDGDSLGRFLSALAILGLVTDADGEYANSPLAARFLVPDRESFAGHFIDYRRFLAPNWGRLAARVRGGAPANDRSAVESSDAYRERVFSYVRAMDFQARVKAVDAVRHLARITGIEPRWLLDIGGGPGRGPGRCWGIGRRLAASFWNSRKSLPQLGRCIPMNRAGEGSKPLPETGWLRVSERTNLILSSFQISCTPTAQARRVSSWPAPCALLGRAGCF
jgi:hypothetical protein